MTIRATQHARYLRMAMGARLRERLAVSTCIACGARSRIGDCPDGCSDVPLDLVEAAEVDALAARIDALAARSQAFRGVLEALVTARADEWEQLRRDARSALRAPLPEVRLQPDVVQAWGCPECGRVDAPQPCLGVCIRYPVVMADAREYEALVEVAAAAEREERALAAVVRLVAQVTPRPGSESRTRAELAARARAVIDTAEPGGRRPRS